MWRKTHPPELAPLAILKQAGGRAWSCFSTATLLPAVACHRDSPFFRIRGAIINRTSKKEVAPLYTSLRGNVRLTECPECLFYVIPEVDTLALLTIADVKKWIGAEVP